MNGKIPLGKASGFALARTAGVFHSLYQIAVRTVSTHRNLAERGRLYKHELVSFRAFLARFSSFSTSSMSSGVVFHYVLVCEVVCYHQAIVIQDDFPNEVFDYMLSCAVGCNIAANHFSEVVFNLCGCKVGIVTLLCLLYVEVILRDLSL